MDPTVLLSKPPFSSLEPEVKDYLASVFREEGTVPGSPEEVAEVAGAFLLDAGLISDEDEARTICRQLWEAAGGQEAEKQQQEVAALESGSTRTPCTLAATDVAAAWEAAGGPGAKAWQAAEPAQGAEVERAARAHAGSRRARQAERAEVARASAAATAALADPSALFRLPTCEASTVASLERVLRAELPMLSSGEEGSASSSHQRLDYLAAAFVADAEDRGPQLLPQWQSLLAGVLERAEVQIEGGEGEGQRLLSRAIEALVRRGVLEIQERPLEAGSVVLALLPEDSEWHPAVIEEALDQDHWRVIFLEYGKPQAVTREEVRSIEDVADDEDAGELRLGECEMCRRHVPLTFHHLIPKDTHPTYLKKRLPRGIEGEPTRGFLNSYGLMVCRQCHSMVHKIAGNSVLATDYNTLEKILAHPSVQPWVAWASKQHEKGKGTR